MRILEGYDPRVRLWVPAFILVIASGSQAAPVAPSEPDDTDLKSGTCSGHVSSDELLASLPASVPELVLMWPRVGRSRSEPCQSVGRLTVVDHSGFLVTASFVLRSADDSAPEEGYRPWYTPDGGTTPDREGPPRNEMTWVPDGAGANVHVVVAGAPSTSEETLEGVIGFLSAVSLAGALGP
jgi:hypothetical protein